MAADLDVQVDNPRAICLRFQKEYLANPIYHRRAKSLRQAYGYIEAEALHPLIRHFRPCAKSEIEVGRALYLLRSYGAEDE